MKRTKEEWWEKIASFKDYDDLDFEGLADLILSAIAEARGEAIEELATRLEKEADEIDATDADDLGTAAQRDRSRAIRDRHDCAQLLRRLSADEGRGSSHED